MANPIALNIRERAKRVKDIFIRSILSIQLLHEVHRSREPGAEWIISGRIARRPRVTRTTGVRGRRSTLAVVSISLPRLALVTRRGPGVATRRRMGRGCISISDTVITLFFVRHFHILCLNRQKAMRDSLKANM